MQLCFYIYESHYFTGLHGIWVLENAFVSPIQNGSIYLSKQVLKNLAFPDH